VQRLGLVRLRNLYYGWIIVVLGAFVLATNALAIFGFGVFIEPLTWEFGWERGALSGADSMGTLIAGVLSLASGRLSDRSGPRILVTVAGLSLGTGFLLMSQISSLWQVYLVWGLSIGIAVSCSLVPINSTIARWFTGKRGIAIAIPLTGFSVGAVTAPLLVEWLISAYGWRLSFLILALMPLVVTVPLAQFMKRDPQQIRLKPYGESDSMQETQSAGSAIWGLSVKQASKTRGFWLFCLTHFAYAFCVQTIVVHVVPHAIDIGIPRMAAASILSIVAGSSVVGRLSTGLLSDRIGGRPALTGCLALVAFILVWLLFAGQVWAFWVFAVPFGLGFGGVAPLLTVVSAELFGVKSLGAIFGAVLFSGTLGGAIGPPLSGRIFDMTGSYDLAFTICVILAMLATILSLALLRWRSRE